MRSRVFLVVGILLLSFGIVMSAAGLFEVSEVEGIWDRGYSGINYAVTPANIFKIKDVDGNITSSFEKFTSKNLNMNESGNVKSFQGVTELGAILVINGEGYSNLPAGAEFEYSFGETSVKSDEDFLYESDAFGPGSSTRISGDGKITVKDGVVSSESPFTIHNPETGDVTFSSPSGGKASVELDWEGKPSHLRRGTDADLKEYGTKISSPEGTNIYWDECSADSSYACIYDDQITIGANNGGTTPTFEADCKNAFYKCDSETDSMRIYGEKGKTNNIDIKKDIVDASGEGWNVENGDDLIRGGPNGNIYSSKIDGSENTAMPMKIYGSDENGMVPDYSIEVDEDGALGVEKMGVGGKTKYLVERVAGGGTYDMSGDEFVTEGVSEALSFDGNFESGEIVEDYKICDSDGCIQLSNVEIDCGTMKRSTLYHKCGTLGVDCDLEGDPTQTVKNLYSASQKSGGELSVTALTSEGRIYNF